LPPVPLRLIFPRLKQHFSLLHYYTSFMRWPVKKGRGERQRNVNCFL
jgi:hypothetical protein